MRTRLVIALVGLGLVATAGCARYEHPRRLSIKDSHAPVKETSRPHPAAQQKQADDSLETRARKEQAERCAQRHVDYQAGRLKESVELKQALDAVCAELHRNDHAQDPKGQSPATGSIR